MSQAIKACYFIRFVFHFLRWYQLWWSSPCYFPYFLKFIMHFPDLRCMLRPIISHCEIFVKDFFLLCFLSIDDFSFFVNFFVSFFSYSSLCWQLPHFNLPSMVYVNLSLVIIFKKKLSWDFFFWFLWKDFWSFTLISHLISPCFWFKVPKLNNIIQLLINSLWEKIHFDIASDTL